MSPVKNFLEKWVTNVLKYPAYALLTLLSALAFGTVAVLGIPVYLFRLVVILLSKYFRPDLGKYLNPLSSILAGDLFSTKPPRSNIVIPLTLDRNISLEEFEKLILDKWINAKSSKGEVDKYPQFKQFPVSWLGFLFWKRDDNFNIKNHVLSHPNTNWVTDKELNEFIEGLLNAPHNRFRSPWEFHILQNYRNPTFHYGDMSVLVLKYHHCLADGSSIMKAIVQDIFGVNESQLGEAVAFPKKKSFWEWLIFLITVPFTGTYELCRILSQTFRDSPWSIPEAEKSWHQLYAKSGLIPVELVKRIENTFEVTFTSVILSAISLAISRNLEHKKINRTLRKEYEDGDGMYCMSTFPLSPNGRKDLLTNKGATAIFRIPTGSFANSRERLYECNKSLLKTKSSVVPAFSNFFVNVVGSYPRRVAHFIGKNRMIPTGLSHFKSVDGDPICNAAGRKCLFVESAVGGLEGNAGVSFTVSSYQKHIRVAVTAEGGLLSRDEVNALVESIEEEIFQIYSQSISHAHYKI